VRRAGAGALALLLGAALAGPGAAGAEDVVAVYLGVAWAPRSDLRLREPGGTDVTYHDVSWRTRSLTGPVYYGVRLTHWLEERPGVGVALDFTHAKIYLRDTSVRVTGTRGGTPVDQVEPVSDAIRSFNNSHGVNLLTVNALARAGAPPADGPGEGRRLRPYAGVGVGLAVPHVEAEIGGGATGEYQVTGPAVQALAGLEARTGGRWTVFGEYKAARARLHERLHGGRAAALDVTVHQVVGGVGRRF
jgi:lipid A oxidase